MVLSKLVYVVTTFLVIITPVILLQPAGRFSTADKEVVEILLKQWAPLIWLAPEEKFMPLGVEEFLQHVHAERDNKNSMRVLERLSEISINKKIPMGDVSEKSYLVTNLDVEKLLDNKNSFLYGRNPTKYSVPIYAVVKICDANQEEFDSSKQFIRPYIPISLNEMSNELDTTIQVTKKNKRDVKVEINETGIHNGNEAKENNQFMANVVDNIKFTPDQLDNMISQNAINGQDLKKIPSFYVTYWVFYPYSQGKAMCTLNLGPFGHIPIPVVFGTCLGTRRDFGSHVGDWEHMSIFFSGSTEPDSMYVSAHDAGAYYTYNRLTGSFEFKSQETRKGILQKPNFPKTVITSSNHPVLFAAQGSHGLWTAPGRHRFVRVARLYDINGFGTPWYTWKDIEITYENLRSQRALAPPWYQFRGKWGNPKKKCHPLRRIGLNFCEYSDGPTGIPLKKTPFQCSM